MLPHNYPLQRTVLFIRKSPVTSKFWLKPLKTCGRRHAFEVPARKRLAHPNRKHGVIRYGVKQVSYRGVRLADRAHRRPANPAWWSEDSVRSGKQLGSL